MTRVTLIIILLAAIYFISEPVKDYVNQQYDSYQHREYDYDCAVTGRSESGNVQLRCHRI